LQRREALPDFLFCFEKILTDFFSKKKAFLMNFPLKVRQWSREDGGTAKSWALYKIKNAELFLAENCSRKSPS